MALFGKSSGPSAKQFKKQMATNNTTERAKSGGASGDRNADDAWFIRQRFHNDTESVPQKCGRRGCNEYTDCDDEFCGKHMKH
jgi:hypothetical protein